MSNSFIGSKIAIVTKSQCRYVGTIIGIDAQASSILLGNVKCFGTENRGGNFATNQMAGTIVPIMQFANSDIEDLKIVEEESNVENQSQQKPVVSSPPPPAPPQKQLSIHDDPAIVSAVVSTSNKDLSMSSRLINDLQQLNLSDEQSKKLPKTEESRLPNDSGDFGPAWSLLSSSSSTNRQDLPSSNNKSKFFDDFSLNNNNNPEQIQSNRSQRWPSNTHSTQTSRKQQQQEDDNNNNLPVRQPFYSSERPYPQQQQQNRYQNGYNPQRSFHNNRRPPMNNYQQQQQRRIGGNRETFNDNGNNYNDDFDFETSNRRFNKIASEDEFKQQSESPNQFLQDLSTEYEPIYDKKKSFFDSIHSDDTSDTQAPMYNRTRNQDTFGNDRNQYQRNRGGGGGYRRPNNNNNYNNRQQQGNENFYHRQNNNGYHYRY